MDANALAEIRRHHVANGGAEDDLDHLFTDTALRNTYIDQMETRQQVISKRGDALLAM